MPGWTMNPGNSGAVEVRVFFDLLCPDSMAGYYLWKMMLPKQSPVEGMTYNDLVEIKIIPYVLPYHLHSYQMA